MRPNTEEFTYEGAIKVGSFTLCVCVCVDSNHCVMNWFKSIFQIVSWVMSRFGSNFRKVLWVMSWFEWKYSGSFLSREPIWMNSCKAIVSHALIQIKTFWDWVESNEKKKPESYPCLLYTISIHSKSLILTHTYKCLVKLWTSCQVGKCRIGQGRVR